MVHIQRHVLDELRDMRVGWSMRSWGTGAPSVNAARRRMSQPPSLIRLNSAIEVHGAFGQRHEQAGM